MICSASLASKRAALAACLRSRTDACAGKDRLDHVSRNAFGYRGGRFGMVSAFLAGGVIPNRSSDQHIGRTPLQDGARVITRLQSAQRNHLSSDDRELIQYSLANRTHTGQWIDQRPTVEQRDEDRPKPGVLRVYTER